jgi:hypothetical protein
MPAPPIHVTEMPNSWLSRVLTTILAVLPPTSSLEATIPISNKQTLVALAL